MEKVDCLVIGAGVVGLAIGRALALAGREVFIVEAQDRIGLGISSRNSEVIHAGLYYPENSLKASLCVSGNHALYKYCQDRHIPHRQLGKLIVATDRQQEQLLVHYLKQGRDNGVKGLSLLGQQQLSLLEPSLSAIAAIKSASTGIVDSESFMRQLEADMQNNMGQIIFKSPVLGGDLSNTKPQIELGGISSMTLECNWVINAAGLAAPTVAKAIGQDIQNIPTQYFAKGHYFSYAKPSPFKHLIYPVAVDGGLGIHLTLDIAGQARFGPDVQWVEEVDYSFNESRIEHFIEYIRGYYPELDEQALQPGYTGIRPKLGGPGNGFTDFLIQDQRQHGSPGLVNLFGIESPGLTSSLAIGKYINKLIKQ